MCDCEPMDCYREIHRKARKVGVKCHECGTPCKRGDGYTAVTGLIDGRWAYFRVCDLCMDILEAVAGEDAPCFGGTLADILPYEQPHRFELGPGASGHWHGVQWRWAASRYDFRERKRRELTMRRAG